MVCVIASGGGAAPSKESFEEKALSKITRLAEIALTFDHYVFFKVMRMEKYKTEICDRSYTAGYLHRFIMPSNLGMDWIIDKLKKKTGFDPIIIEMPEVLDIFFKSIKEEACFFPFIFRCRGEFDSHVTPAFYLKNEKGAYFVSLDSVAMEPVNMTHSDILAKLPAHVTYIHNTEKRQVDGFSCRVESIFLLKQLHDAAISDPEIDIAAIFLKLEPSDLSKKAFKGMLKGSFLKTSQFIIRDERKDEMIFGKKITLEAFQRAYRRSIIRFIGPPGACAESADPVTFSVYLQCKAIGYYERLDLDRKKEE